VYTHDGAVQSKHPVYPDDGSLGRINANWITPPHTAASIKRYLSKEEQIAENMCTSLFSEISSPSSLDDNVLMPILTGAGPGSSPGEPLALVINPTACLTGGKKPAKQAKLKPESELACCFADDDTSDVLLAAPRPLISAPAWFSLRKNERRFTSEGPPRSPLSLGSSTQPQLPDSTNFRKVRAKFNGELTFGYIYLSCNLALRFQWICQIQAGYRTRRVIS
jgi:hypothetical protein